MQGWRVIRHQLVQAVTSQMRNEAQREDGTRGLAENQCLDVSSEFHNRISWTLGDTAHARKVYPFPQR